jgi:hypothetical protein
MAKYNNLWVATIKVGSFDNSKETVKVLSAKGAVLATSVKEAVPPMIEFAKQISQETGLSIEVVHYTNGKVIERIVGKH